MELVGALGKNLRSFSVVSSTTKLWFVTFPLRSKPVWMFYPGRGSGAGYLSWNQSEISRPSEDISYWSGVAS